MRAIVEDPTVKDGSGKEVHICSRYLWALKVMKYKLSGVFITSLIQLKLDQLTMFEWQSHGQDQPDVPHYMEILKFIDL